MRISLPLLIALAGCAPNSEPPRTVQQDQSEDVLEFVNTNEARTVALAVPDGASALAVDLGVALSIGDVAYTLEDPSGAAQWTGTTDTPDTLMTWRTEGPAPGMWTMTLRPASATGAASVTGRTE